MRVKCEHNGSKSVIARVETTRLTQRELSVCPLFPGEGAKKK